MEQNNHTVGVPDLDTLLKEAVSRKKDIELRSDEVQEVMNHIPPWILRRGITALFLIVMLLLIGSWFFKYPDVISAQITVTSLEPPASIIARSTGKIDEIFVKNSQLIKQGEPLAVIQNPANTLDMLTLIKHMENWGNSEQLDDFSSSQSLSLGNIQSVYAVFLTSLNDFRNYRELNYYPQKIASQQQQLVTQREYHKQMRQQNPIVGDQYRTSKRIYERDSLLFSRSVISENEYDISKNSFLQSKQTYMSFNASLKQFELQLMQGEENLLDLKQQASELESKYQLALRNATEALNAQIKAWERDFLLISPIDGVISQMGVWSENQNVSAGETVFTVNPTQQNIPKGKALLPIQGAGKVKQGQRVNVRINNFPDQEFGYLIGKVESISSVPTAEGFYVVDIDFPSGMNTNYGKTLPITQQIQGNADIITENLRLLERFFMPIKKLIKNQQ